MVVITSIILNNVTVYGSVCTVFHTEKQLLFVSVNAIFIFSKEYNTVYKYSETSLIRHSLLSHLP